MLVRLSYQVKPPVQKNIHQASLQCSCTSANFIENFVSEDGEGFGFKIIALGNDEKDKGDFRQQKAVLLYRN